jgi:hypothetical protein
MSLKKIIFITLSVGMVCLCTLGSKKSYSFASGTNGVSISSPNPKFLAAGESSLVSEIGSCPVITVSGNETHFDFSDCPIDYTIQLYGFDGESQTTNDLLVDASESKQIVAIGCKKSGTCRAGAMVGNHNLASVVFSDGDVIKL